VKYLHLGLLLFYCGFIFYLSGQSSLPTPMLFPHQDKLFHAVAYAVMAFLAINAFKHQIKPYKRVLVCSFVFCALYGLSDEWHQSFIAGREASALDWLADCAGSLLVLITYHKIKEYTYSVLSRYS